MEIQVLIRNARKEDIPVMADMLSRLFDVEEDFEPDEELQRKGLEMLMESGGRILCAEADGRVVGMMTMQFLVSTAVGGLSGVIEDVYIQPEFRSRGIARNLMAEMERQALEAGCLRMQLVADEDNTPAHGYYRAMGWRQANLRSWMRFPTGG